MKKVISLAFAIFIIAGSMIFPTNALSIKEPGFDLNCKSATLIDANTKTVLYSKNSSEALPPASVTKVMTLLLVFEAISAGKLKYDDILTVSENASSMGGSQIFLEPGEKMSVDDLLKSVIIASANDAALTLAEHVAGSEEAFVEMMNNRASELKMVSTHFENVTGLDDDAINHLTSSNDIAIMSCELLKYEKVSEYATIWMDTVRNGEFGLTNTNRLIRYYSGITGLKTGYTSKAGYCVSASAKRGNLHLVAVIMGAETSNERNNAATKLLDYGFSNYSIYSDKPTDTKTIDVYGGVKDKISIKFENTETLINKGAENTITKEILLEEYLNAPIRENEEIGKVIYKSNGEIIAESKIFACETVEKLSFWGYIIKIIKNLF